MSRLTERLKALRVHNEHNFLELAKPSVRIDYSSGNEGWVERVAIIRFFRDGKPMKATLRADEITNWIEARRTLVARAQEEAGKRFGVTEWVRLPWPDSWTWIPRDAYDRVMNELKRAEEGR